MADVLRSVAISSRQQQLLPSPSSCSVSAASWKRGVSSGSFFAKLQRQQSQHVCSSSRSFSAPPPLVKVVNTAPWLRWWEKDGAPNMIEIRSMQQFIDELTNAGEKLVIVKFYSRSCAGCKSLYPKLCKIAREHAEVVFLKINFDDNTDICKALNVRVLPLFFVYRAQGRLESFSCTISKIQRLKDAIAKYNQPSSLGSPASVGSSIGSLLNTLKDTGSDLKDAIPV